MGMFDEIMRQASYRSNLTYGICNEGDYYEDVDGYQILHCGECNQPKQTIRFISKYTNKELEKLKEEYAIKYPSLSAEQVHKEVYSMLPPKEKRIDFGLVGVPCKCQLEYKEGIRKREFNDTRVKQIRENSYKCFDNSMSLREVTVKEYSKSNKYISAIKKYANNFGEYYKEGKGLALTGKSGTGKTIASLCLANLLLDRGYKVKFKMQKSIAFETGEDYNKRNAYLNDLIYNCHLLIIDEFNLVECSDMERETIFYVIDSRIKAKNPTVLTTNHKKESIEHPPTNQGSQIEKILGRINESCTIIEDNSHNYRRA